MKKQGWPIRVPKVTPPEKVPSKVKVPSKINVPSKTKVPSKIKIPSASPIPLHDKNSNNKRQPKDASQKIKRYKNSKSPDTRGNNSPPVPPRVQSPPATPAGPSGANRSRSRSPLVSNSMPKKGPNDNNDQEEEGEEEDEEYEGEGDYGDFHSVHSDSEESESDDMSEQANNLSSAGLRKELLKLIKEQGGEGGDALKMLVEGYVDQERRVAALEKKSARNSGESG